MGLLYNFGFHAGCRPVHGILFPQKKMALTSLRGKGPGDLVFEHSNHSYLELNMYLATFKS
jgi:hypothetical protein